MDFDNSILQNNSESATQIDQESGSSKMSKDHDNNKEESKLLHRNLNTRSKIFLHDDCTQNASNSKDFTKIKCIVCYKISRKKDATKSCLNDIHRAQNLFDSARLLQDTLFERISSLTSAEQIVKARLCYHKNSNI